MSVQKNFDILVSIILICCLSSLNSLELAPYKLRPLYVSKEYISVSGQDAGGIFAQAMFVSHSSYIRGLGIFGDSTFYRCGPGDGNALGYYADCTEFGNPSAQWPVSQAITDIQTYTQNSLIDSPSYMRRSYMYLFIDLVDSAFTADQQAMSVTLFQNYISTPYYIKTRVLNTSIEMPVINTTAYHQKPECTSKPQPDGTLSPSCANMSVPAEALEFISGGRNSHFINPFYPYVKYVHLQPLRSFNQTEFIADLPNSASMDEIGYYYVPKGCQPGYKGYGKGYDRCKLHVYFHGCQEGREFQGTTHVMESNFLQIAEVNGIVVIFPQILSSSVNTGGCWDFYGFTGSSYSTKQGTQVTAVWRIMQRALGMRDERSSEYFGRSSGNNYGKNPPKSSRKPPYTNTKHVRTTRNGPLR